DIRRDLAPQAALRPEDFQAQTVAGDGPSGLSNATDAVQRRPDDDARSLSLQNRSEGQRELISRPSEPFDRMRRRRFRQVAFKGDSLKGHDPRIPIGMAPFSVFW